MSRLRRIVLYIALSIFSISAFSAPFSAWTLEVNEATEHAAEMMSHQPNAPASDTEHRGAACHHACGAHLLNHLQGYAASDLVLPVSLASTATLPWLTTAAVSVYLKLPERPPRVLPIA